DWERYVILDEKFLRPAEVDHLVGDASKARRQLGWEPTVTFEQLIQMMVESDINEQTKLDAQRHAFQL
ncbi:MAG: GDP-mannose 4,6-dehydratase, partial [Lacisediminihabitans sp.]